MFLLLVALLLAPVDATAAQRRGSHVFWASPPDEFLSFANLQVQDYIHSLGANWISLTLIALQDNLTTSRISTKFLPSPQNVSIWIQNARKVGLKVHYHPFVTPIGSNSVFLAPDDIDLWFSNYFDVISPYLDLDWDSFDVGAELTHITLTYPQKFLNFIDKVRSAAPANLKLGYAALGIGKPGSPVEYTWLQEAWKKLDQIGIEAYFRFGTENQTNPKLAELGQKWQQQLQEISSFVSTNNLTEKPVIFTEVGYTSTNLCFVTTGLNPQYQAPCGGLYVANNTCQEVAYEALLTAVNAESSPVAGLFLYCRQSFRAGF
jgi:hypothetical protein